jgi:hypothetical protein
MTPFFGRFGAGAELGSAVRKKEVFLEQGLARGGDLLREACVKRLSENDGFLAGFCGVDSNRWYSLVRLSTAGTYRGTYPEYALGCALTCSTTSALVAAPKFLTLDNEWSRATAIDVPHRWQHPSARQRAGLSAVRQVRVGPNTSQTLLASH